MFKNINKKLMRNKHDILRNSVMNNLKTNEFY